MLLTTFYRVRHVWRASILHISPECRYVHHLQAVPVEARRGSWSPWNASYRGLPCGCSQPELNQNPHDRRKEHTTNLHMHTAMHCGMCKHTQIHKYIHNQSINQWTLINNNKNWVTSVKNLTGFQKLELIKYCKLWDWRDVSAVKSSSKGFGFNS